MALKKDAIQKAEKVARRKGFRPAVIFLFSSLYPYLREVFLSISQSRKQRGGKDFELQFGKLLELMEVPYQKIKRAYRVDFMIPNDAAFKKNANAAVIVSAKRTLRERWREVVEELHKMRSPNIFLPPLIMTSAKVTFKKSVALIGFSLLSGMKSKRDTWKNLLFLDIQSGLMKEFLF